MAGTLFITGDAGADQLLNTDGTALLIGMLLDQQVPMEVAFRGPATLLQRLGPQRLGLQRLGHLDATTIAAMPVDDFVAVCCMRPAIHRFPVVMARRIHELCGQLSQVYSGRGENVWADAETGDELYERLRALAGFGDEKSKIFVALLGKRMGVRPKGWRDAAGKFGENTPRSVADSTSAATLAEVRTWKRAQKAARLDKQDRPLPAAPLADQR